MKAKFSLEIIPKQVEKIKDLPKDIVDDIYITYIPGASPQDIINASETILNYGFTPIPHCPARTIPEEEFFGTCSAPDQNSAPVSQSVVIGLLILAPVGLLWAYRRYRKK